MDKDKDIDVDLAKLHEQFANGGADPSGPDLKEDPAANTPEADDDSGGTFMPPDASKEQGDPSGSAQESADSAEETNESGKTDDQVSGIKASEVEGDTSSDVPLNESTEAEPLPWTQEELRRIAAESEDTHRGPDLAESVPTHRSEDPLAEMLAAWGRQDDSADSSAQESDADAPESHEESTREEAQQEEAQESSSADMNMLGDDDVPGAQAAGNLDDVGEPDESDSAGQPTEQPQAQGNQGQQPRGSGERPSRSDANPPTPPRRPQGPTIPPQNDPNAPMPQRRQEAPQNEGVRGMGIVKPGCLIILVAGLVLIAAWMFWPGGDDDDKDDKKKGYFERVFETFFGEDGEDKEEQVPTGLHQTNIGLPGDLTFHSVGQEPMSEQTLLHIQRLLEGTIQQVQTQEAIQNDQAPRLQIPQPVQSEYSQMLADEFGPRFDAVEGRLTRVEDRVDDHEVRIRQLERERDGKQLPDLAPWGGGSDQESGEQEKELQKLLNLRDEVPAMEEPDLGRIKKELSD